MIAASYNAFGSARDVLTVQPHEIAQPAPGEVEVLVQYSGINPSDVKKRAGQRGDFPGEFVIPHSDGSGVIVAVGEGISEDRIGQNVWMYEAQHNRNWGTAAELINLPAAQAVKLPDICELSAGACLGIPAMTAHRCLTIHGDIKDQTVLITGAQGRVAYYAVQMAVAMGATVIATVGSMDDAEEITALGATLVLDYHSETIAGDIIAHLGGAKLDLVVDVEFGNNLPTYLAAMADNSAISAYASMKNPHPTLPFYELMFKNISLHPIIVYSMPQAAKELAVTDITRLLEQQALKHRITQLFPLEEIVEAHQALEQGVRGSILLEVHSHD